MNRDEEKARARAKEIAPIAAAFGEGKEVESRIIGTDKWSITTKPSWTDGVEYRIAPDPKLRPWKQEEVLPLIGKALWRYKRKPGNEPNLGAIALIMGVSSESVFFRSEQAEGITFRVALVDCEHSTDGGKTWSACGVVE